MLAKFKIEIVFSMFNFVPAELREVFQLAITFSGLFGIILFLLFSADKPSTKNLYLQKQK